jgi:hypothetical protein
MMVVSEGKAIALEVEGTGSAGMNKGGMTPAATHVAAHMAAKSAAVSASATPAVSVGQRRHRRTGCQGRRRGQRDHRLAHRDVSLCLLRPAPTLLRHLRKWNWLECSHSGSCRREWHHDGDSEQNTQMTNKIFSDTEVSFWICGFVTG